MTDWKGYGLVALAGFALLGLGQTASCAYNDFTFLHDARLKYDQAIDAQKVKQAQQTVQPAPPPASAPVPGPVPAQPAPTPKAGG